MDCNRDVNPIDFGVFYLIINHIVEWYFFWHKTLSLKCKEMELDLSTINALPESQMYCQTRHIIGFVGSKSRHLTSFRIGEYCDGSQFNEDDLDDVSYSESNAGDDDPEADVEIVFMPTSTIKPFTSNSVLISHKLFCVYYFSVAKGYRPRRYPLQTLNERKTSRGILQVRGEQLVQSVWMMDRAILGMARALGSWL
uniref:Uncharacterized protein n=1 Tax=Romanomermis culicivorax TaxID=13658 RepID=A0A915KT02_ROMCU